MLNTVFSMSSPGELLMFLVMHTSVGNGPQVLGFFCSLSEIVKRWNVGTVGKTENRAGVNPNGKLRFINAMMFTT